MSDINGFKSSIATGVARANQFQVDLSFPNFVTGGTVAATLGQFHCRSASLPASTFQPVPVFYMGRSINVAGERDFQPWTVAIYNENFLIRDALMKWSHGINNISNNTGNILPAQYQADLIVKHLDRNGTVIKTIKIVDAMPVDVGAIELAWDLNNQVEVFQVMFAYNYFEDFSVNPS